MNLKKVTVLLMASVMAIGCFAGCGSKEAAPAAESKSEAAEATEEKEEEAAPAAEASGDVSIGVSLGTLKQERWAREADMFQQFADENGYAISIQSANDDTQLQISQCENLLNAGIDVLILQPLDGEAVTPIIEACKEEGVPVISYDRMATNCDVDYYVTFDTVKVGELEAQFVVDQAPKGNYIWLLGGPEDQNATLLEEGQANVLQEYIDKGDINIVTKQWCDGWDPNLALNHTENGLSACNNDLQGLIASNDGTCGGAVEALSTAGLDGKVPCCGQDADLAACQRIIAGTQTGTVFKPTVLLNKAACQLAVALATGGSEDDVDPSLGVWTTYDNKFKDLKSFAVDVIAVDKDNLYDVIIKEYQYQTLEDVYANVPKDQWPAE
ncbi:MAG: substrate-binding domain-containing protein [Lachnospiraceae bacterium]|nr:substrate-binding domain-containing protein [Lachnospiraceae bacterium]